MGAAGDWSRQSFSRPLSLSPRAFFTGFSSLVAWGSSESPGSSGLQRPLVTSPQKACSFHPAWGQAVTRTHPNSKEGNVNSTSWCERFWWGWWFKVQREHVGLEILLWSFWKIPICLNYLPKILSIILHVVAEYIFCHCLKMLYFINQFSCLWTFKSFLVFLLKTFLSVMSFGNIPKRSIVSQSTQILNIAAQYQQKLNSCRTSHQHYIS